MANGFHGSTEDWQRCDRPLVEVDEVCKQFAAGHGLVYSSNERSWPSRDLIWGTDVRKKISIALEDERGPTYTAGAVAWSDRTGRRRTRHLALRQGMGSDEVRVAADELLRSAFAIVDAWKESDLEESR